MADGDLIGEREFSKLRWRSRRGLLENDLLIEKFFAKYEGRLTESDLRGMYALMDLADNDLLDLLLRRKEPEGEINTNEVRNVLSMIRI